MLCIYGVCKSYRKFHAVVLEQPREGQNVTETVATTVLTDIKPEKEVFIFRTAIIKNFHCGFIYI
jgi:hypothetical protein